MWHSRHPPAPLHGKYHLKFPFWLSAHLPNCQSDHFIQHFNQQVEQYCFTSRTHQNRSLHTRAKEFTNGWSPFFQRIAMRWYNLVWLWRELSVGAVGRVEQSSSSPPSLDLLSKVEHVTDLPKESPTSLDKDLLSSSSTSPSSPSASLLSSSLLQVHSVQKKKRRQKQEIIFLAPSPKIYSCPRSWVC